ncbi:Gfo/Idh/MocA family protein [Paenibacillus thalictri]|uniref:Gfo/Idh/MocA family oxidoreductase n=1 Tax=Paenibacillus thalictri TaxID=2527873 RepID=A0A4Q9DQX7_9BACL|nr:Gfo/Idh/MocA family oxidoreductase [Paenibacillus thalictri]TBL79004.1 Gfo/Idh/MocA family oxidoreductase [Paenibacillus thalictri]
MKAALVGGGHAGLQYAQSLSRLRHVEVAGICGMTDEGAVQREGERPSPLLPAIPAFSTYEEMMEFTDPDLVCVCVPADRQRDIVLKSIERGKHVVCEAPFGFDVAQLRQAVQAAEAKGVHLFAGVAERFAPHMQDIKSKLDKGAIGSAGVVHIQRSGPYPVGARQGGAGSAADRHGVLGQWLIGDMFLLRWMLGEVNTVFALNTQAPGVDYALVTLRFASGAIANLAGYWGDEEGSRYRIELAGNGGVVRYDSKNTASFELKQRGDGTSTNRTTSDSPSVRSPYDGQLADVLRCIAAGAGTKPLVAAEDVAKVLELAEAAFQSAVTGEPVQLQGGAQQ